MYASMYIRTYACMYIHTYICTLIHTIIHIYIYIHIYMYASMHLYVCMYICIHMYECMCLDLGMPPIRQAAERKTLSKHPIRQAGRPRRARSSSQACLQRRHVQGWQLQMQ